MPIATFTEGIRSATEHILQTYSNAYVLGLGATYPNGLDGTMGDLAERFPDHVLDVPCSENALTGMAVGMAISGLRPIVHHGRIEFALHAMDQIITQAAKWNYMFGGDYPCPLTLRIAIGRQWGNGPQHTLNHKALFAVPGLKVVCPSSALRAQILLCAALEQTSPVVFLESRWLYKTRDYCVPSPLIDTLRVPANVLSKAVCLRGGSDVSIVAVGDAVIDALKAARLLDALGIFAEVIDVVSVSPLDKQSIRMSARKTKRVLAVDYTSPGYNVASEVLASIQTDDALDGMTVPSFGLTCVDSPCPTAPSLSGAYYPNKFTIANCALDLLGKPHSFNTRQQTFAEENLPPTDNFEEL